MSAWLLVAIMPCRCATDLSALLLPFLGWLRAAGCVAMLFGFYYFGAALDDIEGRVPIRFYQSTILGRLFLSVVFLWLAINQLVLAKLILGLAFMNVVSALFLARALFKDGLISFKFSL